jgi:hypothetical protein
MLKSAEREIVLFVVLALEAHFLLGLPQLLDVSGVMHMPLPLWGSLISAALSWALAYNFKPHFVTMLVVAIPTWLMLQAFCYFVTAVVLECLLVWAFHELIRPASRDRNLVGQGFADPAHPGTLKPFPSLDDEPKVHYDIQLSVVVPACGEAKWLQDAITKLLQTLQARAQSGRANFTYEVILVVCLKSPDMYNVAQRHVQTYGIERVRTLRVTRPLRAGRALREGALRARGEKVLLLDLLGLDMFSQVDAYVMGMGRTESREGGMTRAGGGGEGPGEVTHLQAVPKKFIRRANGEGQRALRERENERDFQTLPLSPKSPASRLRSPRASGVGAVGGALMSPVCMP